MHEAGQGNRKGGGAVPGEASGMPGRPLEQQPDKGPGTGEPRKPRKPRKLRRPGFSGAAGSQIGAALRQGGAAVDLTVYVLPALILAWVSYRGLVGPLPGAVGGRAGLLFVVGAAVLGAIAPDLGLRGGLGAHVTGRRGGYAAQIAASAGYRAEPTHSLAAASLAGALAAPLATFGPAGVAAAVALCGSYSLHLLTDALSGRRRVRTLPRPTASGRTAAGPPTTPKALTKLTALLPGPGRRKAAASGSPGTGAYNGEREER